MNKIKSYIRSKILTYSQVKVKHPVVVFESDDWGLDRSKDNVEEAAKFGKLKHWAYDKLESIEDLEYLYQVLEKFKDVRGRNYKITSNFVVANPDYHKTIQSNYENFYLKSINELTELKLKWREGIDRGIFYPQYHGKSHFNLKVWLRDLQNDFSCSRQLFDLKLNGGVINLKKYGWRYHSEYFNWIECKEIAPKELANHIKSGLEIFKQVFGYHSTSTIAPHYMFTPNTTHAFKKCGIKYIQGGNQQLFIQENNKKQKWSFSGGSGYYNNLVILSRNVKFEPARKVKDWDVDSAYEKIKWCFKNRIPAVIDSHRINYTGEFAKTGLQKLNKLINKIYSHQPYVLSSSELGGLIESDGYFTCIFTGEHVNIPIIKYPFAKSIRNHFVVKQQYEG